MPEVFILLPHAMQQIIQDQTCIQELLPRHEVNYTLKVAGLHLT